MSFARYLRSLRLSILTWERCGTPCKRRWMRNRIDSMTYWSPSGDASLIVTFPWETLLQIRNIAVFHHWTTIIYEWERNNQVSIQCTNDRTRKKKETTSAKRSAPVISPLLCEPCGKRWHHRKSCFLSDHPDCNEIGSWMGSRTAMKIIETFRKGNKDINNPFLSKNKLVDGTKRTN